MEISLIADATMVKTSLCVDELGGAGGLGLTDVVGKGGPIEQDCFAWGREAVGAQNRCSRERRGPWR